ncbi:hypothetical protein F6X42_39900 [Paraburkholderia sp. WC7.3b]|uniref:Uncharacterized protein n=1 Tax=Paraburkholderia podalyriae TaxID=1938811 RepID=A0ABR7Q1J5_9BURK|nr:hypothetical protein [Paraburkholderia podalyriae]
MRLTAVSFLRPMSPARAMSRSESPCRIRTRTWRYSNNSNLRLAMGAPLRKERSVPSWESSNRVLLHGAGGAYTPIIGWRHYGDHGLAPLRRSCAGAYAPIINWLLYGDP